MLVRLLLLIVTTFAVLAPGAPPALAEPDVVDASAPLDDLEDTAADPTPTPDNSGADTSGPAGIATDAAPVGQAEVATPADDARAPRPADAATTTRDAAPARRQDTAATPPPTLEPDAAGDPRDVAPAALDAGPTEPLSDVVPAALGADAHGPDTHDAHDAADALDDGSDADATPAPDDAGPSMPPGPDAGPDASPPVAPVTPPDAGHGPPDRGPTLSTGDAIKAVFGLILLLALAYIGGHPRVQRLEAKLRISQVITAGFPFVLIGLVSREDALGILSEPVLDAIRPLLPLGLGWIGFAVGFRFDVRKLDTMPPLAGEAFVFTTAVPYFFILTAVAGFYLILHDGALTSLVLRDAFVLATAGAMTAFSLPRILARHGAAPADIDRVGVIIQLEELAALLGIVVIAAFFRPTGIELGWQLPSVGWVFVTIGIGTALSVVVFALLGTIKGTAETLVVMLGSICFAAGMASFLRLSPVVVCFIAGAVLTNFPGPWKDQVRSALSRVERPVYLLFLVIAGALWRVDEWQGWVLMLVFVAARLLGRVAGANFFARRHPESLSPMERRYLAISPMGALSLAIIVTAQDLYSDPTVTWMVNAVIGGAILTEVIVQILAFERPRAKQQYQTRSMPAFVIEHADAPSPHAEEAHAEHDEHDEAGAPPDAHPDDPPADPDHEPGAAEATRPEGHSA